MSECAKNRRLWSDAEENLLCELWACNNQKLKNSEFTTKKEMQVSIHKELSLHFDISLKDVMNKMYNVRRQYRNAVVKPSLQAQWKSFNKFHALLQGAFKPANRENENSTDESIWTIEDSSEYIGCEPVDTNDCEPEAHVYQLDLQNDFLQSYSTEQIQQIIDLDDEDDTVVISDTLISSNTPLTNANGMQTFQSNEYEQDFANEQLTTAAITEPANTSFVSLLPPQPLQAPNTNFVPPKNLPLPSYQTDFEQAAVAQKVYLCQPVQPQPTNNNQIPVAVTVPNSEAANTSLAEVAQAKQNKSKSKKLSVNSKETAAAANSNELLRKQLNKPPILLPKEPKADNTAAMLQKLTSIESCLRNFTDTQDNLTRQIYRENLQQTMLLTRILDEEQRRTKLMEQLLERRN